MADGADIREEGKPDEFFFGLQVNQPITGRGGGEGGLETVVYGTRRMRVKNLFIYFLFFFGGGWGIKETVSIWILELEVVKSQITI